MQRRADLDGDGDVDVFDMFDLLNAWGTCEFGDPPTMGAGGSLQSVVEGAGLTMDDWDEFEDVMVNSQDPEERANYRCWMENYLSGCTTCPPCPGKDPFD